MILILAGVFTGGAKASTLVRTSATSAAQRYKCDACGMASSSQSDLAEHVKNVHAMPK